MFVDAGDFPRLVLGGGERGQQHGREDCDDCDHDEQLDERERHFMFVDCFSYVDNFSVFIFFRPGTVGELYLNFARNVSI